VDETIFAYAVLIEPLFILLSEFESRETRFHMRERKLATFYSRMKYLARKYNDVPDFAQSCVFLETMVFLKFAKQNHDLALLADGLTLRSKRIPLGSVDVSGEPPHLLDGFFESFRNDRTIAAAIGPDADVSVDEEEEEEEEEMSDPTEMRQYDNPNDFSSALQFRQEEAEFIRNDDSERGLYGIGSSVISDYAQRAHWPENKRQDCLTQLAYWGRVELSNPEIHAGDDLSPPVYWMVMETKRSWLILAEYAQVLMSLPIAETENERTFSVRKYIVGDRGGMAKNDLITARVRLRAKPRIPSSET
jgi:hypothetical protein